MRKEMRNLAGFAIVALALVGCATPEISHMEGRKYFVHQRSNKPGIGPPVDARIAIYEAANKFCEDREQEMKTIVLEMSDAYPLKVGRASLEFECVEKQK